MLLSRVLPGHPHFASSERAGSARRLPTLDERHEGTPWFPPRRERAETEEHAQSRRAQAGGRQRLERSTWRRGAPERPRIKLLGGAGRQPSTGCALELGDQGAPSAARRERTGAGTRQPDADCVVGTLGTHSSRARSRSSTGRTLDGVGTSLVSRASQPIGGNVLMSEDARPTTAPSKPAPGGLLLIPGPSHGPTAHPLTQLSVKP